MASAAECIKQDWKSRGKIGVPKIGWFDFDNENGHMCTAARRIYIERAGFQLMGDTYHEKSVTDAVSQVAFLKK
jgi:hypothetical protein